MKKLITTAVLAASFSLTAGMASAADAPKSIDQLLQQVKVERAAEGKVNSKREQEFQAERGDKAALLQKEKNALAAEKQRGKEGQTTDGKMPVVSKAVIGGKIR